MAGGVSIPLRVKPTPPSTNPPERIPKEAVARQFELSRLTTAVCEVVVKLQLVPVFVAAIASGGNGSRLMAVTTNTSRSSGERFRSTEP